MGIKLPPPSKKEKDASPIFGPCLLWPNVWIRQDATWYGGRLHPGGIVLEGDPAHPIRGGGTQPPNFGPCPLWCQTAGWIKMPLGMEVGLDLGDFVLDGELSSLTKKRDTAPNFWHYCGQTAWSIRIPVGTEVGLGPGDIVLDEDPALPPPNRGTCMLLWCHWPIWRAC